MGWREEFGEKYEVPKFIDFLVAEGIVKDFSWHNDASPSFGALSEDETREVRLWVAHPLLSHRQGADSRFYVTTGQPTEESTEDWAFEDLQPALERWFAELASVKGGPPVGVKEWSPGGVIESPWQDPQSLLDDLLLRFYE